MKKVEKKLFYSLILSTYKPYIGKQEKNGIKILIIYFLSNLTLECSMSLGVLCHEKVNNQSIPWTTKFRFK